MLGGIAIERCANCFSVLVMVTVPRQGRAPKMEYGCKKCEELILVSESSQLYKRPADWPEEK